MQWRRRVLVICAALVVLGFIPAMSIWPKVRFWSRVVEVPYQGALKDCFAKAGLPQNPSGSEELISVKTDEPYRVAVTKVRPNIARVIAYGYPERWYAFGPSSEEAVAVMLKRVSVSIQESCSGA